MRSFMVTTYNKALLSGQSPSLMLMSPVRRYFIEEAAKAKAENRTDFQDPPKTINDEIFQFLELNDDVARTYRLGYFDILNLTWPEWINLTSRVIEKKKRMIIESRREQSKQEKAMRHLENPKKRL